MASSALRALASSAVRARGRAGGARAAATAAAAAAAAATGGGFDRPRVGVSAVVLRRAPQDAAVSNAEAPLQILMVRRANEPSKGMWAFPGGSLELGESLEECAIRECAEETGVLLHGGNGAERLVGCGVGTSFTGAGCGDHKTAPMALHAPEPFTVTDAITFDADGKVDFHYAVVQMAALPIDPTQEVVAGDDAEEAQWMDVLHLRKMSKVVRKCTGVAEMAAERYGHAIEAPES